MLKRTPILNAKDIKDIMTQEGKVFSILIYYCLLKEVIINIPDKGIAVEGEYTINLKVFYEIS